MEFVKNKNIKLAIISPSKELKSETFITAHKELLPFNSFFYYDGFVPTKLNDVGSLIKSGKYNFLKQVVSKKIISGKEKLSYYEFALLQSFREQKINIVLAEYGPTGASVCNICKLLNTPLIVYFHGYDASVKQIINQYDYEALFKCAETVFSVSKIMTSKLVSIGCDKSKIVLNPCVPSDDFLKVSSWHNQELFISVGRFVEKKAPYYTILAFKEVLKYFPGAKLIMGGEGPLREACYNLVRYLKIEASVELPGIVDKEYLLKKLQHATAFVQHSVTALNGDMEGTPVAILEACAAGVPVIATNHAGIPDVILHGVNGLLVAEHDVDAMSKQMIYLLQNPGVVKRLGAAAKQNVVENFTMKKHIDCITGKIIAAYEKRSSGNIKM